jgi:hypothetical protein
MYIPYPVAAAASGGNGGPACCNLSTRLWQHLVSSTTVPPLELLLELLLRVELAAQE